MPKKMRRLALRCVLSTKVKDGELKVVEQLPLDTLKTSEMQRILTALGAGAATLIATGQPEANVIISARNLPGIKTTPAGLLNVADILSCKMLIMTEDAIRRAEQLWGTPTERGETDASL